MARKRGDTRQLLPRGEINSTVRELAGGGRHIYDSAPGGGGGGPGWVRPNRRPNPEDVNGDMNDY